MIAIPKALMMRTAQAAWHNRQREVLMQHKLNWPRNLMVSKTTRGIFLKAKPTKAGGAGQSTVARWA